MFSLREYHAIIRNVLALLKTLFDIMRLRKGPDAIPYSQVLLVLIVALWLGISILSNVLLGDVSMHRLLVAWAASFAGLAVFILITSLYGRTERVIQMTTSLLGTSIVFALILTVIDGIAGQLLATDNDSMMLTIVALSAWSVYAWAILVDGHILSQTINQPRFVGTMIAFSVFILQLYLLLVAFPPPDVPVTGA